MSNFAVQLGRDPLSMRGHDLYETPACAAGRRVTARTHQKIVQARALVEAASVAGDLFTRTTLAQALALLRDAEIDTAVVNPPHTERRASWLCA